MKNKTNRQVLSSFFKQLLLVSVFVFSTSYLFSQELIVTTKPDPVQTGQTIRFSLFSEEPMKSVKVWLSTGEKLVMTRVNNELYIANYIIPLNAKSGLHSAIVQLTSVDGKEMNLPPTKYMVVPQLNKDGGKTPELPGHGLISRSQTNDLHLRISQLEDNVDSLEAKNNGLRLKIKRLKGQNNRVKEEKSKQRELKRRENEIAKLESELDSRQVKINTLMKKLKVEMNALNDEQTKIRAKEMLLASLEKKLKEKRQTLDYKEGKLSEQENLYEAKELSLIEKEKTLSLLENEIATKNLQLDMLKQKLAKEEMLFEKQKNTLKSREKEIGKKRMSVESIHSTIMKRREELVSLNIRLENKKESFIEKQRNFQVKKELESKVLNEKKKQLTEKEMALNSQSKEISDKEKSLEKIKLSIKKSQKKLSTLSKGNKTEKKEIRKEKKLIKEQQKELENTQKEVVKQKKKYQKIILELKDSQNALDQEQAELKKRSKLESKLIAQRQEKLKEMESMFDNTKAVLSKMESEHLKKQKALDKESELLQTRKLKFESKKIKIENNKKIVDELEKELAIKYELLSALNLWIKQQIGSLQDAYIESNQKNDDYIKDFDKRFEKLESLTRLIEKRATKVDHMNHKLVKRNKELTNRLTNYIKPRHRYSFSPYIGLRMFGAHRRHNSAKEGGFNLSAYLNHRFGLHGGFGLLSLTRQTDNNMTRIEQFYMYHSHITFDVNPGEEHRLYFLAGMEGDFQTEKDPLYTTFGMGFKYFFQPDFATNFEVKYGKDILTTFAFEKHLGRTRDLKTTADNLAIEDQYASFLSLSDVDVYIGASKQRLHYQFENKDFIDIKTHWARSDVHHVTALGLMHETENKNPTFNPNSGLTKEETAKILVLTFHSKEFLMEADTKIPFKLVGDAGVEYHVDVNIKDRSGKLIRSIVTDKLAYQGHHVEYWNGRDRNNKRVASGNYLIEVIVKHSELGDGVNNSYELKSKILKTETKEISVKYVRTPTFRSTALNIHFDDVEKESKNRLFINESIRLDIFDTHFVNEKTEFQPTKELTRIEFMGAVSRVLLGLGAQERVVRVDFSPYSDWDEIPKELKGPFTTYVVELGYGGDDLKRLRPNDLITRAEAAVIIKRVLDWKQKFDRKKETEKLMKKKVTFE